MWMHGPIGSWEPAPSWRQADTRVGLRRAWTDSLPSLALARPPLPRAGPAPLPIGTGFRGWPARYSLKPDRTISRLRHDIVRSRLTDRLE